MPTYPPIVADTRFYPVLHATLQAFVAALAANVNPPAFASIRPGILPPMDLSMNGDACCAGMAWVREDGSFPTAAFPTPLDTANWLCSDPPSYGLRVEMGCYRCVSAGSLEEMVTDADWTNATIQVLNDEEAMRVAARVMQQMAPFGAAVPILNGSFVHGAWEPIETQGGCVGGKMTFTIQVFCPE